MIDASRMNWAALTPSRCASRSTSAHRASAKRTVVARIGMGGTVSPTSLPLPPGSSNATTRAFRCHGNATGVATFLARCTAARPSRPSTREHAAEVHRAANAILRDAALAEDVVQEVFERVWRGSGHDERRGPLGPYLTMLARSRALDLRRRSRTGERVLHRLGEEAGALRPAVAAAGGRRRSRGGAPARARGGAAPARRPAPGDRPRLLGRPVGAGAGRRRGHPLRHGEDPGPPGAREALARS